MLSRLVYCALDTWGVHINVHQSHDSTLAWELRLSAAVLPVPLKLLILWGSLGKKSLELSLESTLVRLKVQYRTLFFSLVGLSYSGSSSSSCIVLNCGQKYAGGLVSVKRVTDWPGQSEQQGCSEVPTQVYYDPNGKVRAL